MSRNHLIHASRPSQPPMFPMALQAHQQGKLDQAESLYAGILKTHPIHFDTLHFLGLIKHQKGQNAAAEDYISRALKVRGADANALSNLGTVQAAMGRLDEALASFDRALAADPLHDGALNGRGHVLLLTGRIEEALAAFDALLAVKPGHPDALNNRGVALNALRRQAEAVESYDKAIALRPDYVEAHSNRGDALKDLMRLDEALASYDRALALRPGMLSVLNNRGNLLMQLQRAAEALQSYDAALAIEPRLAELINNRGIALRTLGRSEEALQSFEQAIALRPDYADAVNNRGVTLVDLGRREEALASYDLALSLRPDYVEALNNRGNALRDLDRTDEALACYDRALALNPDNLETLNNRGNLLRKLGRLDEALASFDRLLAIWPRFPEALNNRGGVLREMERPEDALASFDGALALKPDYAEAHENRGVVLMTLGQLDAASAALEQAISLAPRRIRPYYNLTGARKMKPEDPQIQAMEMLAQDMAALSPGDQIELTFALSKALGDIGDQTRSFQTLIDGNALKRASMVYEEAATLDVFERTKAAYTRDLMRSRQGHGDPSDLPVFIIGMPRSGTTLVEQILASHPDVYGAGEIGAFGDSVEACAAQAGRPPLSDDELANLSDDGLQWLGADYVARLRALAPDARRVVNKMPGNFFFAGAIHLALPKAAIIHTRRDPIDTCLSCFSKLFTQDLAYAYDLGELGRYYRAYEALMDHWRAVLPAGAMLEVQYEEVVADLEGQARRIVAHCGLEWDPRCLDFHLTKRAVSTASVIQVRQPIYGSSVGRWRRHEAFLGPLLAEIGHPDG